jgi:MSHA biogenesis protein MshG
MIAVIPKYQGIYNDFHIKLPPVTTHLIALCGNATTVGAILLLIALLPVGRAIASLFPTFREAAPFDGIFWDQLIWWTPVAGGYVRDRGMAELCDILSAAVRTGHPITDALAEAADVQPNYVLRYRASAWSDAVARGQSLSGAARFARMPRLFTAMLATVRGSDSLLEVLAFLRRHYEYRFSRARAVIQSAFVPIVVLILGSAVAVVGMSMMQPIAKLIDYLATKSMGGF